MLFNSFHFVVFFPLVTLGYFILPHKYRWIFLLMASCYFYMALIPIYILVLLVAIVVDYYAGILIEDQKDPVKRKRWLIVSVISTCLLLFVFKYYNFFVGNFNQLAETIGWNYSVSLLEIILPVGLSFHTFQSLSYVIEVYYGRQKAERHFGIYSLYVMFYPQLVAGPIERPQNVLHQFYEKHTFDYARVVSGLRLMLWGLFKKMVIADRLSIYVNQVYNHPNDYEGWPVIIASIFFAYQIYCDFSGYSDIALGAARVMGFTLMENFRTPYYAKSIKEFWSRWHISLSTWFRDYVYIPMGGNRTSKKWKWYYNLFITFLISGFWHGANWTFVAWGALHGLYLIFGLLINELWFKRKPVIQNFFTSTFTGNAIRWMVTMVLVILAWVFFRANSISDAIILLNNMLDVKSLMPDYYIPGSEWHYFKIEFYGALLFILLVEGIQLLSGKQKVETFIGHWPSYVRWVFYLLIIEIIIWFGYYGNNAEFIYFQF